MQDISSGFAFTLWNTALQSLVQGSQTIRTEISPKPKQGGFLEHFRTFFPHMSKKKGLISSQVCLHIKWGPLQFPCPSMSHKKDVPGVQHPPVPTPQWPCCFGCSWWQSRDPESYKKCFHVYSYHRWCHAAALFHRGGLFSFNFFLFFSRKRNEWVMSYRQLFPFLFTHHQSANHDLTMCNCKLVWHSYV